MKKVLIVDDSLFMRGILKDLLLELPVILEIYEADGQAAALPLIKAGKPDLILLDVVMKESELEGLETLREIRKFDEQLPIVMITSVGQTAIVEECKNLNVIDYIEKPFDRDIIIATIKKYL